MLLLLLLFLLVSLVSTTHAKAIVAMNFLFFCVRIKYNRMKGAKYRQTDMLAIWMYNICMYVCMYKGTKQNGRDTGKGDKQIVTFPPQFIHSFIHIRAAVQNALKPRQADRRTDRPWAMTTTMLMTTTYSNHTHQTEWHYTKKGYTKKATPEKKAKQQKEENSHKHAKSVMLWLILKKPVDSSIRSSSSGNGQDIWHLFMRMYWMARVFAPSPICSFSCWIRMCHVLKGEELKSKGWSLPLFSPPSRSWETISAISLMKKPIECHMAGIFTIPDTHDKMLMSQAARTTIMSFVLLSSRKWMASCWRIRMSDYMVFTWWQIS